MEIYLVYMITRSDNLVYIGTTYKSRINKRMISHKNHKRFRGFDFEYSILEESDNYQYIQNREVYYINLYNTCNEGLNISIDGKGNHLCSNFTTKGYKYSAESRKKMSDARKRYHKDHDGSFKGHKHTEENKKRMSEQRKGIQHTTKLNKETVQEIVDLYYERPYIEGVGQVMMNGRKMSYERLFSMVNSSKHDVTPENIYRIIKGDTWKNVQRKYKI